MIPLELVKLIIPLLTKNACPTGVCCGVLEWEKSNHVPALAPITTNTVRKINATCKPRGLDLLADGADPVNVGIAPEEPDVEVGVTCP